MAQQSTNEGSQRDRLFSIQPSRFIGTTSPTFLGGSIDPVTGNLVQGSVQQTSAGSTPTPITPPAAPVAAPVADPVATPAAQPEPEPEEAPFAPYPVGGIPRSMGKGAGWQYPAGWSTLQGPDISGGQHPDELGIPRGTMDYERRLYLHQKKNFDDQSYANKQKAVSDYKSQQAAVKSGGGLAKLVGGSGFSPF